jgi:hypothetical protein
MSTVAGDLQDTGEPLAATHRRVRTPAVWGIVFGAAQASSPLAFWWL